MSNLYNLISQIREYLQDDDNHRKFMSSNNGEKNHKVLCSALDVVNDIDEAIHAYLHLQGFKGRAMNYIYIYGIINCLQSQIIATQTIYHTLLSKDLNIAQDKDLDIIRIIRNKIFAHSAESNNGFGIVASTMTTFDFQPHSFQREYEVQEHNQLELYEKVKLFSTNGYKGDPFTINIKALIKHHQTSLERYLKEVVDSLPNIKIDLIK